MTTEETIKFNELLKTAKRSKNGYSCPNCDGMYSDRESLLMQTEPEFVAADNPGLSWEEIHKCPNCKTIYSLTNGC